MKTWQEIWETVPEKVKIAHTKERNRVHKKYMKQLLLLHSEVEAKNYYGEELTEMENKMQEIMANSYKDGALVTAKHLDKYFNPLNEEG